MLFCKFLIFFSYQVQATFGECSGVGSKGHKFARVGVGEPQFFTTLEGQGNKVLVLLAFAVDDVPAFEFFIIL
jgi:hypothetical protein